MWNVDFGHVKNKLTIGHGAMGEIETKNGLFRFENCLT